MLSTCVQYVVFVFHFFTCYICDSRMISIGQFKKNLNASKPSEHPPQVEECLKV